MKNSPFSCFHFGLVLCFLAGCSRQSAQRTHEERGNHNHSEVSATGSHEGHAHDRASGEAVSGATLCSEHDVLRAECGICRPELARLLKTGESAKVRLAATDSAALAGVQLATPQVGAIADGVDCYAELAFNQNMLAQMAAPVGGIVQEVVADLGERVEERQILAKIWSATIADSVARAILTHQALERERKLRADRVTSEKDLQQAEADHRAACQHAQTLGFTEDDIDKMKGHSNSLAYLEVRAPFGGDIIERTAVRGALVDPGKSLFTLADRSVMWAMLNIPEADLGKVKEGQGIELKIESLPGRIFIGKLTWIGAEIDDKSRMARARAEIPNSDGVLKSKMFAQARIQTISKEGALLLPSAAIQRIEGKDFIFVKVADDLIDARVVRLGIKVNGWAEIVEGLRPLEMVAVEHAFTLKSAFLISRLGAGCADD